jgi:pimeloyl-ACP methyl ester carboxylesterase
MDTAVSADGTSIVFERVGEGPPVVLVGGAFIDRTGMGALAALLAPRFTACTYDRRGRGDSGDTPPYAPERELEDLAAVLAALGEPAFVFGHSSAAALALDAAASGQPMRKLALYEPPFITSDGRPPVPADLADRIIALTEAGCQGEAVAHFLTVIAQTPAHVLAEVRDSPLWPGMEALAHTLVYDLAVMGGRMSGAPLPAGCVSSVSVPVLVMDGGNSPAWQRQSVRELAAMLPRPTCVTIPKAEHALIPGAVAPVLAEFLLGGQ